MRGENSTTRLVSRRSPLCTLPIFAVFSATPEPAVALCRPDHAAYFFGGTPGFVVTGGAGGGGFGTVTVNRSCRGGSIAAPFPTA